MNIITWSQKGKNVADENRTQVISTTSAQTICMLHDSFNVVRLRVKTVLFERFLGKKMNFIQSNGYGYPEECINGNMQNDFLQNYGFVYNNNMSLNDPNYNFFYENSSCPNEEITSELVPDFSDDVLKFINDILMEEDLDAVPATLQDHHALEATEKALYDVLGETVQPFSELSPSRSSEDSGDLSRVISSQWRRNKYIDTSTDVVESSNSNSLESGYVGNDELLREVQKFMGMSNRKNENDAEEGEKSENFVNVGKGRKTEMLEGRSNKQIAVSNEEYVEMRDFDDILICEDGKDDISPYTRKNAVTEVEERQKKDESKNRRRKSGRGRRKPKEEVVDLRNLLIECAQAVTSADLVNANELLKQIRQHASAYGDSAQRVAYYFANGLEARMAGTGSDLYRDFVGKPITSVQILKGYQLYVSAVPFQRTTYFLANQTIAKLAANSAKVHIIDFGIFFGFQWPGLIQLLSRRKIGPPRVRITGVDYPMSGFKPAKKTQETGNRLAGYCQRFGVPFQFHAIAQMWNTLKPEDFNLEEDELVIVSCLYQSGKLADEGIDVDSPRDYFLKLIRKLNADMFIHGVVNGTFNAPFFTTRFREALYHYSALFDVFEANMPRENDERLLIEQLLYGKDAMNIVACEGSERIERPESYKQWQMRHHRVGFTQVRVDEDVVNRARAMVKANYHKDFMVELDRNWMVQGWKGRILSAVSCWKPA